MSIVDESIIEGMRRDYGEEAAKEIVDAFLDDTPRAVERMLDGLATGDHASITLSAHSLKSSALYVGAFELSAAAAAVEELAKRAGGPALREGIERVRTAATAVLEAL